MLCPSRRWTDAGARCDYAAAVDPNQQNTYKTSGGLSYKGLFTVLYDNDLSYPFTGIKYPISMTQLTVQDGASCTMLLAHKGVAPGFRNVQPILCCGGGSAYLPSNGDGYFTDNYYLNMFRGRDSTYFRFYPDVNKVFRNTPTGYTDYQQSFTSPHSAMPCCFCDGSVHMIPFTASDDFVVRLVSYNDGQVIDFSQVQ